VLGDDERGLFERGVTSRWVHLASWAPHPPSGRTYARLTFSGPSPREAILAAYPAAEVREPALCVLAISVDDATARARVRDALGGPGAPVGILDAREIEGGIAIELDDVRTPLTLVVDLIDLETAGSGRRIEPLAGLRDETLAAFAATALATPQIDRVRIVETHLEAFD
jgi:hypothetical protein